NWCKNPPIVCRPLVWSAPVSAAISRKGSALTTRLQRLTELGTGRESIRRYLGQRLEDDFFDFFGNGAANDREGWHLVERVTSDRSMRRRPRERRRAGEHLIEHAAEAVDVGA